MNGAILALVATALYFAGVAVCKIATDRMEPLQGIRIVHLSRQLLSSRIWYVGVLLLIVGLGLQIAALYMIPLSTAQPLFVASLVFLLVIAMGYFGERLTAREWVSLSLIALATLMVGMSVAPNTQSADRVADTPTLFAVVIPSLVVPVILFMLGDLSPTGRHARQVAGIAYGLGIGVLTGIVELGAKGIANLYKAGSDVVSIVLSPYPYVVLIAAGLAIAQLVIALQRCRISIVVSVATVIAKTHLILMGSVLYGEPWPDDPARLTVRVAGLALAIFAVALFPRHEDPLRMVGRVEEPRREEVS